MRAPRVATRMHARPVDLHEWARWRAFRLRALAADPASFGATFAEEVAQPDAWWIARVTPGPENLRLVVEESDAWLGTLGVGVKDGETELAGLWVPPEARGLGVGALLMRAAGERARAQGATALTLWVNVENRHARDLYLRAGFADDGPAHRGTRFPTRTFQKMRKAL